MSNPVRGVRGSGFLEGSSRSVVQFLVGEPGFGKGSRFGFLGFGSEGLALFLLAKHGSKFGLFWRGCGFKSNTRAIYT